MACGLLTEETDWIGGQLTSQAVPPDEHPWIESFGCTAAYAPSATAFASITIATIHSLRKLASPPHF